MSKKKTIRKYDLQEKIKRLQNRLDNIEGQEYSVAKYIFEELRDTSAAKNATERREIFRNITLGVSLELYMWLKKHIKPQSFKYRSNYTVYFGTDEEFDAMNKPWNIQIDPSMEEINAKR